MSKSLARQRSNMPHPSTNAISFYATVEHSVERANRRHQVQGRRWALDSRHEWFSSVCAHTWLRHHQLFCHSLLRSSVDEWTIQLNQLVASRFWLLHGIACISRDNRTVVHDWLNWVLHLARWAFSDPMTSSISSTSAHRWHHLAQYFKSSTWAWLSRSMFCYCFPFHSSHIEIWSRDVCRFRVN